MTEVRFYHLTTAPLERALPQLLEKTLQRSKRALVLASSEERVEALASHLWTYDDRSFLPHGTRVDGHAHDQPIWLATDPANPNGAHYLFLTDGARVESVDGFELCALLFDGGDPQAVAAAREDWRRLKAAGHQLTYWQQDEAGRWHRKAGG